MTSKDDSSVAVTNNMKPHRDPVHQEPTRKDLQEHEADKSFGASGGTFKDSSGRCMLRSWFRLLLAIWSLLRLDNHAPLQAQSKRLLGLQPCQRASRRVPVAPRRFRALTLLQWLLPPLQIVQCLRRTKILRA